MLTFCTFVLALTGVWYLLPDGQVKPRPEWFRSPYPLFETPPPPETGDLGVLRLVLDGAIRREIDAALAGVTSPADTVRAAATILLAHRDAWRSAGAIDVDTCPLPEVPARYAPLAAAERESMSMLDDWQAAPDLGPFRTAQSDPREVLVIVLVLGVRESPVLRALNMDTLVTVGVIGRGDTVAAALDTVAVLGDQLLVGEVLTRNTHAGDLFRAYKSGELVALRS